MSLIAYCLFACIGAFCAALLFFIVREFVRGVRNWWENRRNPNGMFIRYTDLHSRINYASHLAELAHLSDEVLDFRNDFKGSKDSSEMADELMPLIKKRENALRRAKVVI